MSNTALNTDVLQLNQDVVALIHHAKHRAATAINAELTLLYWHVGQRIAKIYSVMNEPTTASKLFKGYPRC